MESSGVVLRRSALISGAGFQRGAADRSGRRERVSARPRFSDEGHLRYYVSQARCGGKKKEEKKKAKLVKALSKDLSSFYSIGFGVGEQQGMAGDVKGDMMKEAAELLLTQLKQMRSEEKEMKRRRKQEKAKAKAEKMKIRADNSSSSSSSSSESSDSECDTVVKMSAVRAKPEICAPPIEAQFGEDQAQFGEDRKPNCCSSSNGGASKSAEKIEVCMGGKCKKSGAMELLAEFERMVGLEGAVVGCKCMGKCRDGPNVRVLNHRGEGEDVKPARKPLCIGVGLEDVGAIVSNYFGESNCLGELLAA